MSKYATKYFQSLGQSHASLGLRRLRTQWMIDNGWKPFAMLAYQWGFHSQKGV